MTADLRDELATLASAAGSYADPEAALRRADKIRRRRVVVPAAAAVALATIVTFFALVPSQRANESAGPDASLAPSTTVAPNGQRYPRQLVPTAEPKPLPTSRGVGAGAFVYTTCPDSCPWRLVRPDGTEYRLDHVRVGSSEQPPTLSPDGRWLVTGTANGYQLRDLLTNRVPLTRQVMAFYDWSPDGRYALGFHDGGEAIYDTLTEEWQRDLDSGFIRALLNDGRRVVAEPPVSANRLSLRLVDKANRTVNTTIVEPTLQPNETLTITNSGLPYLRVGPGDLAMVPIYNSDDGTAVGVLVFDLATGETVRRLAAGPVPPFGFDGGSVLLLVGQDLVAVNPRTGASTVESTLPPGITLTTRVASVLARVG